MQQSQSVVSHIQGVAVHFSRQPCASPFSTSSSCLIPQNQCLNRGSSIQRSRRIFQQQQVSRSEIRRCLRLNRSILAAAAAAQGGEWIFEPVGDGDWSHMGEQVSLPNAFELSSDAATVGRVEGKADIVVPIGTVSARHARLEKKESMLLVTDLDSTNGTFVDNKRLRPGAVTTVLPGSSITFGDEHLAQFKFLLVQEQQEDQAETSAS